MVIKNFQAETIKCALDLVKREFGAEAVILKTDIIRDSGKRSFSVTAAKDYDKADSKPVDLTTTTIQARMSPQVHNNFHNGQSHELESALLDCLLPELMTPEMKSCFLSLRTNEVELKLAREICQQLQKTSDNSPKSFIEIVKSMIPAAAPFPEKDGSVIFVGPPGSGKSSLLAKFAVELVFNRKKRVSLSTLDNFRPTAEDEIENLAEILGFVENTRKEEKENTKQGSYLLVDTEGLIPGDNSGRDQLIKAISDIPNSKVILVLSLAVSWINNQRFIDFFLPVGIDFTGMTSLDLSSNYGTLLNIAAGDYPPIICLSDSRMPTGSIDGLDPDWLARKLLGDSND